MNFNPFLFCAFSTITLWCCQHVPSLSDVCVNALGKALATTDTPAAYLRFFDPQAVWMSPHAREQLEQELRQAVIEQLSLVIDRLQQQVAHNHPLGFVRWDQSEICCAACTQATSFHWQLRTAPPEQLVVLLSIIGAVRTNQSIASVVHADPHCCLLYNRLSPDVRYLIEHYTTADTDHRSSSCTIV